MAEIDFDVAGAREAGFKDADIADYLARKAGYDIAGARKAGFADVDIITHLTPKPRSADEPAPATEPPKESRGTWGSDLKTGFHGTSQAMASTVAVRAAQEIEDLKKQIETFKQGDPELPGQLRHLAPQRQRQLPILERKLAEAQKRYADAVAEGAQDAEALRKLPVNEPARRFTEGNLGEIVENPGAVARGLIGQSATAMVPLIVGVALGGPAGGAIAGGATGVATGGGQEAVRILSERGIDARNPEAVKQALADPQIRAEIDRAFGIGQAIETGVGAATGALGGVTLPGSTVTRAVAKNVGLQAAGQGAISGAGEAAKQGIIEGEMKPGKIAAAALGEALFAPVDAAGAAAHARMRPRTPEAAAEPVLQARTVDEAITRAREVVDQPAIEEYAGQAQEFGNKGEQDQAAILRLFGGLNEGQVERRADGAWFYRDPDGRDFQVREWDGQQREDTIPAALVEAQRRHYEQLGVRVIYLEDDARVPFDGAVDPNQPNTIFLTNKPNRNAAQVGAHEFTHVLESTTLPDGTSLADILQQQVAAGMTAEGRAYAERLFGKTAPQREAFPDGAEGDSLHADAVTSHLIRELSADIGAEAPKFQTFMPRVVEAVEARFGAAAARDALTRLIAGIRQAMTTLRNFFFKPEDMAEYGQPPTESQKWVTNLEQIHDTLARMYAERYGQQNDLRLQPVGPAAPAPRPAEPVRALPAPAMVTPPPRPQITPENVFQPETYGVRLADLVPEPARLDRPHAQPMGPSVAAARERLEATPTAEGGMGRRDMTLDRNQRMSEAWARWDVMHEEVGEPEIRRIVEDSGASPDHLDEISRYYNRKEGETPRQAFERAVSRWMDRAEAAAVREFNLVDTELEAPRGEESASQPTAPDRVEAARLGEPEGGQGGREAGGGREPAQEAEQPAAAEPAQGQVEEIARQVDEARETTNTDPTDGQKEAGNYLKGRVSFHGLPFVMENPKGSTRSGVDADGKRWEATLPADYGYISRTKGADGDQVDAYIGPHPDSQRVWVVDQIDPKTGEWDEHKVMLGMRSVTEARTIYHRAFSDGTGPKRVGAITEMSLDQFKAWLENGDTKSPVGEIRQISAKSAEPTPVQKERAKLATMKAKAETGQDRPELAKSSKARPETTADHRVAEDVANMMDNRSDPRLGTPGPFHAGDLQRVTDRIYGGTLASGAYSRDRLYDAMELGVNRFIQRHPERFDPTVDAAKAKEIARRLDEMKGGLPTQTVRAGEKDAYQQFSTPPDYAYAANWVANLQRSDHVLEPSAGVGGLLVHAMNAGVRETTGNELSDKRRGMLKALNPTRITGEDAAQLHNILPDDVRPTVVVMNPPFSRAAERMGGKMVLDEGAKHIEQALQRLEPGGRLVAIVGDSMKPDGTAVEGTGRGGTGRAFKGWWEKIGAEYDVRANVGVDRNIYSKYGTAFPTRFLVIDKNPPSGRPMVTGQARDAAELIERLQEVRNDRSNVVESVAREPSRQEVAGRAGPQRELLGATGAMGAREGRGERAAPAVAEPAQPQRSRGDGRDAAGERPGAREPVVREQPEPADRGAADEPRAAAQRRDEPAGSGADRGRDGVRQDGSGEREQPGVTEAPDDVLKTEEAVTKPDDKGLTEAIYEPYRPQRVTIVGAKAHPGALVQSAAMASVLPPKTDYKPRLPQSLVKAGALSDAQLEAITYAGHAHSDVMPDGRRRGFFIGDGTGVGKGREIAGILLDNKQQGRTKAVWISEKRQLINDAKRDWNGLGQPATEILDHGKVKASDAIKADKGILFTSYDTLKSAEQTKTEAGKVKGRSRVDQIVEWVGPNFDGVIAFDEAHNLGNATDEKGSRGIKKAAQKALAGVELQQRLPNARVVYVSATGATEVSNLAYADRLGLWGEGTPFANRQDFMGKVSDGGMAAMELVARDMKALGHYIARNLSYDGVQYERVEHKLTADQRGTYDKLAEGWQTVLQNFEKALEVTGAMEDGKTVNGRARAAAMSAFWGAHQRFFNQIITSMQMPSVLKAVEKDLKEGRQAVLQLVNTMEAAQGRALEKARDKGDDLDNLDMTPRDQLMQLIEKSFPVQQMERYIDDNGNERTRPVVDSQGNPVENKQAVAMRERLLDEIGSIRVPDGPLEILLNHFGPDKVAEVTGRGERVVRKVDDETGQIKSVVEKRGAQSNVAESNDFQAGKKKILVFSEAGGTGRSYHAALGSGSEKARRSHYLVQGGWRADKAVQGFGRTHRTSQASAPIFNLVTTDLQGQKRFISSIARRLGQLGALTKGERRTGDQGLFGNRDNLESTEARDALRQFFHDVERGQVEGVTMRTLEQGMGLKMRDPDDGTLAKQLPEMPQFLNRVLSLKIDDQNRVFEAFSERLDNVIARAAAAGTLDVGVETYKADKISKVSEQVVYTDPRSGAETRHVHLNAQHRNHPVSFDDTMAGRNKTGGKEPEYFVQNEQSGNVFAVTPGGTRTLENGTVVDQVRLTSPLDYQFLEADKLNTGNWKRLTPEEARPLWDEKVASTPEFRKSDLHVITGAVLPIWDRLGGSPKIYRLQTDDGERMLARVVPASRVDDTLKRLGAEGIKVSGTPAEIGDRILKGATAELANGWKIKASRVSGEQRLELIGPNYQHRDELSRQGVFSERINYDTRYFIPTGDRAAAAIEAITKNRPVTSLVDREGVAFSPRASRQTDTPEFKRWFGDSKAVDPETGKPRVLYHGTTGDFSTFDRERLGEQSGAPSAKQGFFFTSNPGVADSYAMGQDIYRGEDTPKLVKLAMWATGGRYADWNEAVNKMLGISPGVTHGENIMPVYLSIKKPVVYDFEGKNYRERSFNDLIELAKEIDADGVIFKNAIDPGYRDTEASGAASDIYFAFRPEQIKSATGNRGTFDGGNPDITFSPRITGANETRKYTPEQEEAFKRVGRTTDSTTLRDKVDDARDDIGRKLIAETVDAYVGLKRNDPQGYMAARLANSVAGAQEVFRLYGTLKFDGATYNYKDLNGGVRSFVRSLGPEAHDFLWWVAANRAERLKAEDRENLFSNADIKALKDLNRGELDFDYRMPNGTVTRRREAAYMDALRRYDALNKSVLDLVKESGLVGDKVVDQLWADPFYVPFYREAADQGSTRFAAPTSGMVKQYATKKLKGGSEKLRNDLWENAFGNWDHMIDAALRNRAAVQVLQSSERMGAATKIPAPIYENKLTNAEKAQTTWAMVDGKKTYWKVDDPMVFKAVSALEIASAPGPIASVARWFSRALRYGVTANPLFAVRNLIRDTENSIAVSQVSKNPFKNLKDGFAQVDTSDRLKNLARAMAGKEMETVGFDPDAISAMAGGALMRLGTFEESGIAKTDLRNILDTPNKLQAFGRYIKDVAGAYKDALAAGEDVNRLALYKQLREKGAPHDFASFSGRDLQDFTLRGAAPFVRTITDITPFLNARMQGLYKLGRSAFDADRSVAAAVGGRVARNLTIRTAAVLGAMTLAGLALDAIYQDDPDYRKRTEFDRQTYFWFKIGDAQFRIPKGFELAAISTVAADGISAFFSKEMTGERLANNIWTALGTNLQVQAPAMIQPVLDIATNTRGTGGPIESTGMERMEPDQRYTGDTTLIARGMSSLINDALRTVAPRADGPSPVQIDYLVNAYGAWLATSVIGMADRMVRMAADVPEKPDKDFWAQVTQGLVRTDPAPQSRYVDMLYEQGKKIEQAHATYLNLIKMGRGAEAREFLQERKDLLPKYPAFERVKALEGDLNRQIRVVENDRSLSGEQKRVRIMRLQALKNRAAEGLFTTGASP